MWVRAILRQVGRDGARVADMGAIWPMTTRLREVRPNGGARHVFKSRGIATRCVRFDERVELNTGLPNGQVTTDFCDPKGSWWKDVVMPRAFPEEFRRDVVERSGHRIRPIAIGLPVGEFLHESEAASRSRFETRGTDCPGSSLRA